MGCHSSVSRETKQERPAKSLYGLPRAFWGHSEWSGNQSGNASRLGCLSRRRLSRRQPLRDGANGCCHAQKRKGERYSVDRKSTRLNLGISYAVFCLKKKRE